MTRMIASLAGAAGAIWAVWMLAASASAQDETAPPTPVQTEPRTPGGGAPRTWVSGTGDDTNSCTRTAPCRTFARAIGQTAALGAINCLDPGGYGSVTINMSVTIDCHAVFASISLLGGNAITINFDNFTDAQKTVRLRNLDLDGGEFGTYGVQITGGAASAGSAVFVEDCAIDGMANGIVDQRTGGGALYVTHTTIRNVTGTGIAVAPSVGALPVTVLLDDVKVENGNAGLALGAANAMVRHSIFAGNINNALAVAANAAANVDSSAISGNGTAISAAGTVRLSNSDVSFNGTAVAAGTLLSFTNSRFSGNVNTGTISPIGSATIPTGQQ